MSKCTYLPGKDDKAQAKTAELMTKSLHYAANKLFDTAKVWMHVKVNHRKQSSGQESKPDGKIIGIVAPDKLQGAAKALVAPCQGSVDDILAISTHTDKTPIGIVLQGLRVQITAA